MPGLIDIKSETSIANDLIYKDKLITPNEALSLLQESNGLFDLSTLDPIESDIWKNKLGEQIDLNKNIKINYFDKTQYVSTIPSRSGNFRFKVINLEPEAQAEELIIYAAKEAHNVLLLASLLNKIGYQTPKIKYLKKVKVEFSSKEQKNAFKEDLNESTLGDPNRWVEQSDLGDNIIIMQDIIAMEPNARIYNLSLANDLGEIHLNRRSLRSLAVAFAITNIPESINLMGYSSANITSNKVKLDLSKSDAFTPSRADALWITKRILKLTEKDWIEIVRESQLPETVQVLILEKMKARRNSLAVAFGIDSKELAVKADISNGLALVDGKIVAEFFPGYARRFSYGDPENPLSSSELTKFIGSKGLTTIIDSAISSINSIDTLSTDIEDMNKIEFNKIVEKAQEKATEQGLDTVDIPVKTWIYPTFNAGLILSRNVVAGNFLGTDNRIQLVDSFGVRLNAGAYMGVSGLSPVGASASTGLSFRRTYSHVKPLYSVGQALKYPYKNIIVPLFKRGLVSELNKLKNEDSQDNEIIISEFVEKFKEELEVGDSIIITDSYGLNARLTAHTDFASDLLRVSASALPNKNILSRTHIYRSSPDKIQVYKDFGNVNKIALGINLSVDTKVPVLKSLTEFSKGKAKTKYYNFDISNLESSKDTLKALRKLFQSNSVEGIEYKNPPFKLSHNFKQTNSKTGIFSLSFNKVKSINKIKIETPDGSKQELFRRYDGSTFGNDYQSYLFDLASSLITDSTSINLNSSAGQSGNPGFSFYGKAKNSVASFEAIKSEDGSYKKPFIRIENIWNGWQISKKKAQRLLEKLKKKYNFNLYSKDLLATTVKIFLYNLNSNLLVYEDGIDNLLSLDKKKVENILRKHSRLSSSSMGINTIESYTKKISRYIRNANKYKTSDISKYSKYVLKAVKQLDSKLDYHGLVSALGSDKNFYFYANLDGF